MTTQWQWELILDLIAHLLDPKTLAKSSCVSKSWHSILTSDHLWLPLCLSHYPSLTSSSSSSSSYVSPRSLFALLQTSSSRRLRRLPCTPRISLSDLLFSIDIFQQDIDTPVFSVLCSGEHLKSYRCHDDNYRIFRFEEEEVKGKVAVELTSRELRVVWNVVMKGWGGAFVMMDRVKGKRVVVEEEEEEVWFSEELPGPACCSRANGGELVAEMVVGLGKGGRRVERVSMGLMSEVEWRYLSMEDALLYLQPFLLTN